MAELTVYEAGHCSHPGCMALRGATWRNCRFPARAWLIRCGGQQWLWDTGYASHMADHTRHGIYRIYPLVTPVYFDASQSMAAQLHQAGLRPRDLAGVLLSHLHGDHIAGLRDFAGVPLWCGQAAWAHNRPLRGLNAVRQAFVPGLMPDDSEQRMHFFESLPSCALPAELAPFTHGWALPHSRGEVFVVPLPGHAVGHMGVFVLTDTGWVLIASDAAWAPESYQQLRGPSMLAHVITHDRRAFWHTLRQLNALHRRNPAVNIVLTHEGFVT